MTLLQVSGWGTVESTVNEFVAGLVDAVPNLLTGLLFLGLAYVGIRVVLGIARRALERAYPEDQQLVVELVVVVVGIFLWFGAGLALLKILGMGQVAASLGTAGGFLALGVSYALSNVIADTVSGVYLLRDPDIGRGETVTAASITGEVREIGLRKTRLATEDGDTVVLANSDVDERWTKTGAPAEA